MDRGFHAEIHKQRFRPLNEDNVISLSISSSHTDEGNVEIRDNSRYDAVRS